MELKPEVINAANLTIGSELVNQYGEVLNVEQIFREDLDDETVDVYNFQVDEYHTYFAGKLCVLVHNAQYVGENGAQTNSKTTWKNCKTERIDVENPNPGVRNGNIHYHDPSKKYYYEIETKTFIDAKTGKVAPKKVQIILQNDGASKCIQKALNILGE